MYNMLVKSSIKVASYFPNWHHLLHAHSSFCLVALSCCCENLNPKFDIIISLIVLNMKTMYLWCCTSLCKNYCPEWAALVCKCTTDIDVENSRGQLFHGRESHSDLTLN